MIYNTTSRFNQTISSKSCRYKKACIIHKNYDVTIISEVIWKPQWKPVYSPSTYSCNCMYAVPRLTCALHLEAQLAGTGGTRSSSDCGTNVIRSKLKWNKTHFVLKNRSWKFDENLTLVQSWMHSLYCFNWRWHAARLEYNLHKVKERISFSSEYFATPRICLSCRIHVTKTPVIIFLFIKRRSYLCNK